MSTSTAALCLLLAALVRPVYAADSAVVSRANALAESMRQAGWSDGFEVRMSLVDIEQDGHRSAPLKIAVVGRYGEQGDRLSIRGISPKQLSDHFYAAERRPDGEVRAIAHGKSLGDGIVTVDPFTRMFDTELTLWDMLGAWWSWSRQSLGGTETVAGRDCTLISSKSEPSASAIKEVVSCVDLSAKLSLRTNFFDGRHVLVRTIEVEQTMRKESGLMAAKKMLIRRSDNSATEVVVYGGDEHYSVSPDTFYFLDYRPGVGQ